MFNILISIGVLIIGMLIGALSLCKILNDFTEKHLDIQFRQWLRDLSTQEDADDFVDWLQENHYEIYEACRNYLLYCAISIILIIVLIIVLFFI